MRRDHRPYWWLALRQACNRWYSQRFVAPHFDHLGEGARFLAPQSLEVHGANIRVGRHWHAISSTHKPIRLTTWGSKQGQGEITIGDYCLMAPGVEITAARSIQIGDSCMFASDVSIQDSDWHGLYNRVRPFRCTAPIRIGDNVWVGQRALILKGVTLGDHSVIGAGSVVTGSIPPFSVAAGNPARVIKTLNPNRRRLTRAFLFRGANDYWQEQDAITAYFTLDNTSLDWLRSCIAPSRRD
jgi:acetyltransferase-like isoleucine patch superfamily enzyme